MTFDGYDRLQTKHVPEQNAGTATTYSYNNDDTINSVTDARGASATYAYNNRQLVTGIAYSAPGGITATAPVTFGYDAAGNRTSMTDGFGGKSYSYNSLSQLMSETRTLNGVGTFTLSYDYNLGGELKKITDPTNVTINYGFDSTGRLSGVTGSDSLYAGVSTYASNLQYRAWGAAKHLNYGNSLTVDLGYNNRLQATQYDLKTGAGAEVMGLQYQYTSTSTSTDNDGRLKYSHDLVNSNLDRTYSYDQAARLTLGDTANGGYNGPYKQTYGYDAWGNLTYRNWRTFYYNQYCHCMVPQTNYSTANYSNNRNTATGWNYDADGRLQASTDSGANFTYGFDAAGQLISNTEPGRTISQGLDGDGLRAKWVENGVTTYYVRSSALGGQTVVELDQYGQKVRGFVYGGGQEIAKQEGGQVLWDQRDVSGVSMRLTNSSGGVTSKVETDPLGTQVSDSSAFNQNGGGNGYGLSPNGFYGDPTKPNMGCSEGGFEADCNKVQRDLSEGIAAQCPNNNCGPQSINGQWYSFHYTDNGAGWMTSSQFFGVPNGSGPPSSSGPPRLVPHDPNRPFDPNIELPLRSPHYLPFNIAPQNTSGQNPIRPECFYPQAPPEADLNANTRTAEERRKFMEQSLFFPGADATTIAMNHILWFRDQVKKYGPWDYNHSSLRTPEEIKSSIYDSFGNFHYGAVGAAAGFDQNTLLRAAGYAQETRGDTRGGGGQSGGLVGVFTGIGAKAPYGDKPEDQEAIRMGYAYYQKGCYKQ